MLVVNDVRRVILNMIQEYGTNSFIDKGFSESGDFFEVIHHPSDRDPIDFVGDDFPIRAIPIGFAAEHAHIMSCFMQRLRKTISIVFHTAVGSGRISIRDE